MGDYSEMTPPRVSEFLSGDNYFLRIKLISVCMLLLKIRFTQLFSSFFKTRLQMILLCPYNSSTNEAIIVKGKYSSTFKDETTKT